MILLEQDALFASLGTREVKLLLAVARERKLRTGQTLYRKGETLPKNGACFYGLIEGSIKIFSVSIEGKETIFRVANPGYWFGEVSVIDGRPRDHDAIAIDDVRLVEVPSQAFHKLMSDTNFAFAIVRLMARRLRMLYPTVEIATSSEPVAKVAHRLLLMAYDGAATIQNETVYVSQESLCSMLGLSRPTLLKALKLLTSSGAITQQYAKITILDAEILKRCASS